MSQKGCRLTAKQEAELQEAFTINDIDDDKKVTKGEAATVMRCIGISPTLNEINEMLSENRQYTLPDLQAVIARQAPPVETEDNLREAFRIFDKDGNGLVDAKELSHVLCSLGEKLSEDEVDQMIRAADITADNMINYDDFVRMIMSEFSS